MNQFEDFFTKLVDECLVVTQNHEILGIIERHDIESRGYTSEFQLANKLYGLLKERFQEHGKLGSFEINTLSNQLALEHLIFDRDIDQYFKILSLIGDYTNGETTFPDISETGRWKSLIILILDYLYLSKEDRSKGYFTDKLKFESAAAKYWIKKGYNIVVLNGKIKIDDETYNNISLEVEKKLITLGGYNVLEALLKKVPYDAKALRYRLLRNEETLELPVGYLINLSVKNLNKLNHHSEKLFQQNLNELFLMATNLVALLQLQEFNKYSHILVNEQNFIQYLYNNVLNDKIINFRQYNPLLVPKIIKGILNNLFKEYDLEKKIGADLGSIVAITNYILNNPEGSLRFRRYKLVDFERNFPSLSKETLIKVLDIFSHNNKTLNKSFRVPNDISDYELKPLILKKDIYILIDRTLNSISFYEAISQFMRNHIENFDSKLGFELESFIKTELEKRNVTYSSGYYNQNEECDLIIETAKYIFFIEIKKKPLTRKALSGDDVTIFSDIAKGLLSSQLQLGKREIELLKNGKIELYLNKGKRDSKNALIHTVKYDNRIIERVSLNAWDFGVMNDKIFSQTLLEFLTGVELSTKQVWRQSDLDEVNSISMKLHKQFEEIQKYSRNDRKTNYRELYFDCSFISLQMFLIRIRNINGNQEFEENMETLKYVTSGAGDPYFEFDYFKKIKKQSEDLNLVAKR
ncbi:hypothetical protein [Bacillus sp. FJAT-29937]|uniref:hypothetical protein n=1 Tax=Bacillus sp. FJAT-29937 TaxID=1720553 RepID=UPI000835CFDE|nr:hypothetical protein [Bacillus sp. FJAT-29937]